MSAPPRPAPRRPGPRRPGPHELGQNLLVDPVVVRDVVDLVAPGDRPILEWAAGDGALTARLAALGRPLEAVELDARRLARLRRAAGPHVAITEGDILRHAPPQRPHDVVCNVPFSITTPVLRRLLRLPHWQRAVLIVQWEVARKRAGVGGTTQLTAQWWPWFDFHLRRRIPASAFRPRPAVDAGLLLVERRSTPLHDPADIAHYQRWVRRVFTGRGRGVAQILTRVAGVPAASVRSWRHAHGVPPSALPRDLDAEQWVAAYRLARPSPPGRTGHRPSP